MFNSNKAKGMFWNSLGSTMYGANSFIMLAVVSRFGTLEQTGAFGIAFTTAQLLYIVGLLGVSQYQMTDYSEKYYFSDYVHVRIFSSLIMVAGCACACAAMGFSGDKLIYTVELTVLMLVNVIGELYQGLCFQRERLDLSGSILFFRTFWSLLLFCAVMVWTHCILYAIAVQVIGNAVLTWYYARSVVKRLLPPEREVRPKKVPFNLVAECFPLFISTVLMSIIMSASKYGVEFLLNNTAEGYYNLIFIPAQIIDLCSRFIFLPFLRQYEQLYLTRNHKKLLMMLCGQVMLIILFTGGCCALVPGLGIPILELIYQKDIAGLLFPLLLVIIGGGIFAMCQLCYWVLTTLRQQKYILKAYLITLLVMPFMTKLMIERWELAGASLSFASVHMVLLVCYMYSIYRMLRRNKDA